MYILNAFRGEVLPDGTIDPRNLSIWLAVPGPVVTKFALDFCTYLCYDISRKTRANRAIPRGGR